MPVRSSIDGSECQFRYQTARCVFVDGHPGAHVTVGARSARVFIRGEGEIPEATYLWNFPLGASRTPRVGEEKEGALPEELYGGWTRAMILRLLEEIHEAGVSSPHDWVANFRRLRGESGSA